MHDKQGPGIIEIVRLALIIFFGSFCAFYVTGNKECESGRIGGYEYVYEVSNFNTKTITYKYNREIERDEQEDKKKELTELFKLEDENCRFEFPKKSGSDVFLDKDFIDPIVIKCR